MSPRAHHRLPRHHGVNGFILPLTLWMIAIVGLLAATINVWVARAVANSHALAQRTQLELAQANVRNELTYMMGRRATSYRGLEVGPTVSVVTTSDFMSLVAGPTDSGRALKMDGRAYALESDPNIVLMIQDAAGLFNLNTLMPQTLRRVLLGFNIPDTQVNRLADTLQDYIDDDDLTRLAGAEKTQYERLNLRPPSNAFLVTPYEAQRALGWDKLDVLWKGDMESPMLTTCRGTAVNLNTAPAAVLMAIVPGMTRDKVDQLLVRRAQKPFRSTREFAAAADMLITDEPFLYSLIPGSCVVVDLIDKLSGQHTRFSLTLDRLSDTRPWRIDYAIRIPSQDRAALDRLHPEETFPTPESIDIAGERDPAAAIRQ